MPIIPLLATYLFPKTGDDAQKIALVVGAMGIGGLMVWADQKEKNRPVEGTLGALDTTPARHPVSASMRRFLAQLRQEDVDYLTAGRWSVPADAGLALAVIFDRDSLVGAAGAAALKYIIGAAQRAMLSGVQALITVEGKPGAKQRLHMIFTDNITGASSSVAKRPGFSPPELLRAK